jgi:hypothetical protein
LQISPFINALKLQKPNHETERGNLAFFFSVIPGTDRESSLFLLIPSPKPGWTKGEQYINIYVLI